VKEAGRSVGGFKTRNAFGIRRWDRAGAALGTCSEPPGEVTHWTGRAMAEAAGLSLTTIQRIWKAHSLLRRISFGCVHSKIIQFYF
jgi:hypothetical protein